jgi:Rha family phage regulatory protein
MIKEEMCFQDLQVFNSHATISSLVVAQRFGKQHKNILQTIENMELSEDFMRLNFQPSKYLDARNNVQPMRLLTRDGFTILAMGLTGQDALEWKIKYLEAFNKMEAYILANAPRDNTSMIKWAAARLEGKVARREFTDVLKNELIPHAISNGSKSANKYYIHYSKLMHLFLKDNDFVIPSGCNLRDCLSVTDLALFKKIEQQMAEWVHVEIEKNTDYHDIYKKCKEKMNAIISLLGTITPTKRLTK